jgi:hypothetical protein
LSFLQLHDGPWSKFARPKPALAGIIAAAYNWIPTKNNLRQWDCMDISSNAVDMVWEICDKDAVVGRTANGCVNHKNEE